MTLTMCCNIIFPANERRREIVLTRATEIAYESTWKEVTSRGSLTLPRNVRDYNVYSSKDGQLSKLKVSEVFRPGDAIQIYWGYNNQLSKEFTGYVTRVSADIPVKIEFEDEMYKIRRLPVNFASGNISLEKLLKTIVPGYSIDILEGVQLGAVRFSKTQVGPVLEKLKSDWGLYTYMKDKQLVCGKYYADDGLEPAVFRLERNCVSTALNYKKKEDVQIKIKAVSTLRNGTKIEVDGIGDKEGNERQLSFYNITVKAELEKLAKIEYQKYKVDRFDGSITTFGIIPLNHGMKVKLLSTLYPDREGTYYIERVQKTWDIGGIRQVLTLGDKVA